MDSSPCAALRLVPADELPADWREAVAMSARRVRASYLRHPWAAGSLQEARFGPNAMRRFEQFLAAVSGAGLSPADTFDLLAAVNAYVFGNALITVESRKRARMAESDPAAVQEMIAFGTAQLETGQFPHTARLLAESRAGGASAAPPLEEQVLEEQFERGLAALLDGMARRFGLADDEPE